jgi:hypothetical protein
MKPAYCGSPETVIPVEYYPESPETGILKGLLAYVSENVNLYEEYRS